MIINDAVPAEALAITYLTGLIENEDKIGIPDSLPRRTAHSSTCNTTNPHKCHERLAAIDSG